MPETRIGWLAPDGQGVGPTDGGGFVRVRGCVPGDVVAYTQVSQKGREAAGTLDAVVTPSPDRVTPECAWDAQCGGCDLAAFAGDVRRASLARMVGFAIQSKAPIPVVASPRQVAHRARVSLAIDGVRVGYHATRSHELVEPDLCRIARPEVQAAWTHLRAWLAEHGPVPYASVEIRSDGARTVFAFSDRGQGPIPSKAAWAALGDVALDGKRAHGDPTLRLSVAGLSLRASASSFYQVNLETNALLVDHVVAKVREAKAERVLDLYTGIGNLALPIAASGVPVVAVERDGAAIHDLKTTAAEAGLKNIEALAIAAERFDPSRTAFDVAVLDPPRAGAGEVLGRVLRNRPRRLIYLSCNIQETARDLRAYAQGYKLVDVTCFELFPDTHHIETVLVLDRV